MTTFTSSTQGELEFILFLSIGMFLLYPMFLILINRFGLPSWTRLRPGNTSRLESLSPPERQKQGHLTWIISIILFVLCFGSLAGAIVGTLQLAKIRQRNAYLVYSPQPWWGKSVVLQSSSTTVSYSVEGNSLANLSTTIGQRGWMMEIHDTGGVILTINYPSYDPIQFNATCQPTANNTIIDNCVLGQFVKQPTIDYEGYNELDPETYNPRPEFTGFLNLTVISPNPLAILNVSSNPNVWASAQSWQGIGGVYAPLGEWYIDNATLLQAGWSLGTKGPCQGLRINLSKDYEETAWIVVGIIWQWWMYWAEYQGACSQWEIAD
jgi:hypothetical protein